MGYLASEFVEQQSYPKIYPNKVVAAAGALRSLVAFSGPPQIIAARAKHQYFLAYSGLPWKLDEPDWMIVRLT